MFNNNQTNTVINSDNAVGLNQYLTRMFGWMCGAVLISALSAYAVAKAFPQLMMMSSYGVMSWGLMLVWIIMPFMIGRAAMRSTAEGLIELAIFAMLTGVSFSSLCAIYTGTTLSAAFVSSAAVFGGMSLIGLTTHKSMAKLGTQLTGALIGLCVAMLINLFLKSSPIEFFLSIATIVIFALLTMFEVHQFKAMYENYHDQVPVNGLAINGALALYMDFINIFVSLLEIFGGFGNSNN